MSMIHGQNNSLVWENQARYVFFLWTQLVCLIKKKKGENDWKNDQVIWEVGKKRWVIWCHHLFLFYHGKFFLPVGQIFSFNGKTKKVIEHLTKSLLTFSNFWYKLQCFQSFSHFFTKHTLSMRYFPLAVLISSLPFIWPIYSHLIKHRNLYVILLLRMSMVYL